MATIAAVLDACVLYPARLRDLLLSLAAADLFRPIWSDMIHEEWISNVLTNRPDLTRHQLERTRDLMNRAFPNALVWGFEAIIPSLVLPDPDDRHVVASAIHARADLIVTINLSDFPAAALMSNGITAVHPDTFVDYLFELDEDKALAAIAKMRRRLQAPSMAPAEFIESIEHIGMVLTASRLCNNATRI
jgi:predicted nucleic acid-binding protein